MSGLCRVSGSASEGYDKKQTLFTFLCLFDTAPYSTQDTIKQFCFVTQIGNVSRLIFFLELIEFNTLSHISQSINSMKDLYTSILLRKTVKYKVEEIIYFCFLFYDIPSNSVCSTTQFERM